jgi:3-deoxy-7-phosphoheptulonate synthase
VAAGADGIIVEAHPAPDEALCDGPQLIPTDEFGAFVDELRAFVTLMGKEIG